MRKEHFILRFHPPILLSLFFAFSTIAFIYYQFVLDPNFTSQQTVNKIFHLSDLLRYINNPICLLIIGIFFAQFIYLLIQILNLYVDKNEYYRMVERQVCSRKPCSSYPRSGFFEKYVQSMSGREEGDIENRFRKTFSLTSSSCIEPSLFIQSEWLTLCDNFLENHKEKLFEDLYFLNFGVWVLPILGFIGTVIGISQSITGLNRLVLTTQDQLAGTMQESLGTVLSGLSTAFDTTFLGLVLAVIIMFSTMLLKRRIIIQIREYFLQLMELKCSPAVTDDIHKDFHPSKEGSKKEENFDSKTS